VVIEVLHHFLGDALRDDLASTDPQVSALAVSMWGRGH
jgi:hypothetical protein